MKSLHQHAAIFPWLASSLHDILVGFYLQDAFAASKEELVLVFVKEKEQLSLCLNVEAKTGLLLFFEHEVGREGGALPLFKTLIGQCIVKVSHHLNNRSFAIAFENNLQLIFKLYGGLSNVLLADQQKVLSMFRSSIQNDKETNPNELAQAYPIEALAEDTPLFICKPTKKEDGFLALLTQAQGEVYWQGNYLLEALHEFGSQYLQLYRYTHLKASLEQKFSRQLKGKQAALLAAQNRVQQLELEIPPEEIGHIIMANLHHLKKGMTSVNLFDFYRNQPLDIALKKDLSAADNAAYYYKKAKNRILEKQQFIKRVETLSKEVLSIQASLIEVQAAQKLKELKRFEPKESSQQKRSVQPEKFKHFSYLDFDIYIGKSSENNDELTQRFAKKDDLWLHARGVAGSHVVIKKKPGKDFPKALIEYAASLAAYYSKAKGSGLVPVIYTPKKFVRKPKGANVGQVLVEKEEVILVEPKKD
jgi:predicted ribosome quality control (RQC) complex YloA/Tae2 family protein